jgi:large subunit ribosomal protein L7e
VSISFSIHCNPANISSVPTQNDIAVPESVLKKQKAHQKTSDSQAAELKKKREV